MLFLDIPCWVGQVLQKLPKFDIIDLKLLFHCYILIPRICSRKTPFKTQSPPPPIYRPPAGSEYCMALMVLCYYHTDFSFAYLLFWKSNYGENSIRRLLAKNTALMIQNVWHITHKFSPWTHIPLGEFLWFLPTQMMHNDHNLNVTIVRQIEIKSQNPDQKQSQHKRQSQIALVVLIKPLPQQKYWILSNNYKV